jgi:hypothetical protein
LALLGDGSPAQVVGAKWRQGDADDPEQPRCR